MLVQDVPQAVVIRAGLPSFGKATTPVRYPFGRGIGRFFLLRQRLFQRGAHHGGFGHMAASTGRLERSIEIIRDLQCDCSHESKSNTQQMD